MSRISDVAIYLGFIGACAALILKLSANAQPTFRADPATQALWQTTCTEVDFISLIPKCGGGWVRVRCVRGLFEHQAIDGGVEVRCQ